MKKKVIVVDLDGTLYNSTQRSHHIQAKDWEGFHAASINDPPNQDVIDLIKLISWNGSQRLIFMGVTGRNERYREITMKWLLKHHVPLDELHMRPDDNYESDIEIKTKLLSDALQAHDMGIEDVWFALEDRDRVVDHFRSIGIPTYQVRQGTY